MSEESSCGLCGCPLLKRRVFLSVVILLVLVAAGLFWSMRQRGPDWMPEPARQNLMEEMHETQSPGIRERAREILQGNIGRVCVLIDDDGKMALGGGVYDVDAFRAAIEQARQDRGDVCVVVQASPLAGMDMVESVAAVCMKLGVKKVSFHVEGGGWNHVGLSASAQ